MNYSEWQLAFSGSYEKILKLEDRLQKMLHDKNRTTSERIALSIILDNKIIVAENKSKKKKALSFGHSNTKCDETWKAIIKEIIIEAKTKLKIAVSYGRLGKAMDDYEFILDDELPMEFCRSLLEVRL